MTLISRYPLAFPSHFSVTAGPVAGGFLSIASNKGSMTAQRIALKGVEY